MTRLADYIKGEMTSGGDLFRKDDAGRPSTLMVLTPVASHRRSVRSVRFQSVREENVCRNLSSEPECFAALFTLLT